MFNQVYQYSTNTNIYDYLQVLINFKDLDPPPPPPKD